MNIVITGASGFIGKAVANRILKDGNDRILFVLKNSLSYKKMPMEEIMRSSSECLFATSENADDLYRTMDMFKPDLVIHIAGVFLGEHAADTIGGMLEANVVFATVLFDAAYRAGCRKFINTGSCWQNFGGSDYDPVNLYAATKQAAEDILRFYVSAGEARAINLTIFDSYGPGDTRKKLMKVLSELKDGDEILMSGGEQKMYLVHIDDIVRAYARSIEIIDGMKPGTEEKYAVRGEEPMKLRDIVDTYLRVSGKKPKVVWGGRPYRKREIMDPFGWGKVLPGWKAEIGFEEGIEGLI